MGSSKEEEEEAEAIISRRKQLPLLSIQLAGGISRHDFEYSPEEEEEHESGMLTLPLYTSASVPFRWEEEPGKPRPCTALITTTTLSADNIISKGLELPPRLQLVTTSNDQKMTKMPSPTTVLDGPYYNLPLLQSSSFRFSTSRRRRRGSFGISSCGSPDQRGGHFGNSIVPMSKKGLLDEQQRKGSWRSHGGGGGGGFFGSWRRKSHKRGKSSSVDVGEGSFVFSSSPVEILAGLEDDDEDEDGSGGAKVSSKITATRNGSFSSLSHVRSHFWATIYKGFKQVLPLKSTSSKKDGGLPV